MLSLGEKLRAARVRQGLEIAELAARTKISARFLEAIESDRRDQLPAGFFLRSWAVQYATALSLNLKEIRSDVDRILSVEAPLPLPGQLHAASKELRSVNRYISRPAGRRRLMFSFLVLFVVVLSSGFLNWWPKQQQERQNSPDASHRTSVPEQSSSERRSLQSKPATIAPTVPSTYALAAPPAVSPDASLTADAQQPAATDALRVELYAREQTWVTISPDGKQAFSGVLEPNESKTVQAHESARIRIENAGVLDVRFNGKPVGEIGPKGKVRVLLVGRAGVRILEPADSAAPETGVASLSDGSATLALALEE